MSYGKRIRSIGLIIFCSFLAFGCKTGGEPDAPSPPEPEPTPGSVGGSLAVYLTAPINNTVYTAPATVVISANASTSEGGIDRVEFHANDELIGSDSSAPYQVEWSASAVGEHILTATVFGTDSTTETSSAVKIQVSGTVSVSVADKTVSEGTANATVVFSLSEASDLPVDISFSAASGTAIQGQDFLPLSGDVTFEPGQVTRSVPITVVDDDEVEPDETFTVRIDSATNATIAKGEAQITITDDDPAIAGTLQTYPATQEIKTKYGSGRFAVTLNQNDEVRESFVYRSPNSFTANAFALKYMQEANHWTTFSFSGSVEVTAERLDGLSISTCVVRPLVLNIQTEIRGNACSFTVNQPAHLAVEIDETANQIETIQQMGTISKQVVRNPLLVFANPPEESVPEAADPGVIYFGPGVHEIGKQYFVDDNTEVYIEGGAFVRGAFKSRNSNPKNITIRGRGVLSGIGIQETSSEEAQWSFHSIEFTGTGGNNLLIEGITIADPLRTCIISMSPVEIRNVKLMSWEHLNDGIRAGDNSVIEGNFLKVQDDNIKLYHSNLLVRNNTVWHQTSGSVFRLSWALTTTVQNVLVEDNVIIRSGAYYDYSAEEVDRPDLRSTNAIFGGMGMNANSAIRNVTFRNIRIEEPNLLRLISLRLVSFGPNDKWWGDPDTSASKIVDGLTFENIFSASVPYKQSTLYGNKGGTIRNIQFKNLRLDGLPVEGVHGFHSLNDTMGLVIEGNTTNVTFAH